MIKLAIVQGYQFSKATGAFLYWKEKQEESKVLGPATDLDAFINLMKQLHPSLSVTYTVCTNPRVVS